MVIIIGEMVNKPNKSRKNKNIKKRNKANLKTANRDENEQQQLLIDNMVDLISEQHSQPQQHNQNQQMVEQGQEEMNRNSQSNQSSVRMLQLNKQKIIFVLKLGQHYKVKIQHEQINKITINPFFKTQQLQINGKPYNSYQPIQQFIFIINKNENTTEELKHLPKDFVKSIDLAIQTIILANRSLVIQECEEPWQNLPQCIKGNDSVLIVGMKNSGKSSLSEYLLHQRQKETILLDCDIGRNSALEGCISLNTSEFTKKIWIGELTPLNNLQTYVRAVKYLFKYYEEHFFTRKLIVNTMGYTTGLGQFLLYQIYQIIKPKSIIVLQSQPVTKYDGMSRIIRTIKKGEYVEKLFISKQSQRVYPTSTTVFYYENLHATSKKTTSRFEKAFECGSKKINHITDLFSLLNYSRTFKANTQQSLKVIERSKIPIFEQSRHKKEDLQGIQMVSFRKLQDNQSIDMRLIALGKMISDQLYQTQTGLFEVDGLGFGYGGFIYSKFQMKGLVGVVSEGIDFEKGFYHLNEKQLIDLQLSTGRLNYMMVMTKGLGTKGMRNNPSKVQ